MYFPVFAKSLITSTNSSSFNLFIASPKAPTPGKINESAFLISSKSKVPHMGWNDLKFEKKDDLILKYIKEGDYVYYVHSYYANSNNKELIAYSEYEKKIPGIVRKDNVYGLQFHPEKSGQVGADILKAYKELILK